MSSKKNSSIKKRTGNTAGKVLVRPSADTVVSAPSHDQIAARAYQLFVNRGSAHGFDMEDWLAAEAELRSGT